MSTFKEIMMKMVNTWSKAYQGEKKFIEIPTIELKTWTEAYNWNKAAKGIITLEEDSNSKYYANSLRAPQNNDIQSGIQPKWNTFDQFKHRAFNIWCIELPNESSKWAEGTCTCPGFLKKFICKHIVGIALRLKYVKALAASKNVPLGQRRKPGRPAKAKKALLIQ